jgi:ABC-2 type transport system permease protein
MWLRSIFRKTLRDYRVAILSWGVGLGAPVAITYAVFITQDQANTALLAFARQFTWYAEPVDILHAGGYVTWRASPLLATIAIWALLAGSRTLRGEEERGSLDVLLSTPRSRARVALAKLAALGAALLLIGLLLAVSTLAGGALSGATPGLGAALLFGLNVALLAGVFGALAYFFSQFTRARGSAAGLAGSLLGLAFVLDSAGRLVPSAEALARLSPIYYYGLSKPLVPSYGANPGALLVLGALTVAFSGAGTWLFLRRDVGAPVGLPAWLRRPLPLWPAPAVRRARPLPVGAWSLQSVYTHSLRALTVPTCWWGLGLAASAALFTSLAKSLEQNLAAYYSSSPYFSQLAAKLSGGDIATNAGIMSLFLVYFPALLTAFALTQANRWAADEEEGRLELLLATPRSRPSVILARFAALTTALLLLAGLLLAAVAGAAAASGLAVDGGRLVEAVLGMVPLALVVAAVGYLLSGWLRTAAMTGVLSTLLVASYAVTFLAALVELPSAVLQLSIFEQYGTPLVSGLRMPNTLGILAVTVAALALATIRFARKDIAR